MTAPKPVTAYAITSERVLEFAHYCQRQADSHRAMYMQMNAMLGMPQEMAAREARLANAYAVVAADILSAEIQSVGGEDVS